jgi:hypothetical protein
MKILFLLGTKPVIKFSYFVVSFELRIATCKGVGVTKIMGCRSDDWIYLCSFTIANNYDSSQSMTVSDSLHSLLDGLLG